MAVTAGEARITINGEFIDTYPGTTLNPGGKTRTAVETSFAVHSNSKRTASKLTLEKAFVKGSSINELDIEDATIQIAWNTGQTHIMRNAFRTDPPDFSDEGKVKYEFQGEPAEEIT